jgi:hypothetical protein
MIKGKHDWITCLSITVGLPEVWEASGLDHRFDQITPFVALAALLSGLIIQAIRSKVRKLRKSQKSSGGPLKK